MCGKFRFDRFLICSVNESDVVDRFRRYRLAKWSGSIKAVQRKKEKKLFKFNSIKIVFTEKKNEISFILFSDC